MPEGVTSALIGALQLAADQGAIGERSLPHAIAHSEQFLPAIPDSARHVVDLGSGGGLPGVVIAVHRPDVRIRLVDRRSARTDVLRRIVARLSLEGQVEVVTGDVDQLVTSPTWMAWADVVTARSFAPPAITAQAAADLLAPDGRLLVSAPPPGDDRWTALSSEWAISSAHPGILVLTPLHRDRGPDVPRGTSSRP